MFPNVFDIVVESVLLAFIDSSSARPLCRLPLEALWDSNRNDVESLDQLEPAVAAAPVSHRRE
jgi:hypothetical protein